MVRGWCPLNPCPTWSGLSVLGSVVPLARRPAHDLLAGAVRVGVGRVGDDVDGVEQRDVAAFAAGDAVDLAVARMEAVVAGAPVERVALLVDLTAGAGVHVAARQRPEVVVAVAAVAGVAAAVGEDAVVAVLAVGGVVAVAA